MKWPKIDEISRFIWKPSFKPKPCHLPCSSLDRLNPENGLSWTRFWVNVLLSRPHKCHVRSGLCIWHVRSQINVRFSAQLGWHSPSQAVIWVHLGSTSRAAKSDWQRICSSVQVRFATKTFKFSFMIGIILCMQMWQPRRIRRTPSRARERAWNRKRRRQGSRNRDEKGRKTQRCWCKSSSWSFQASGI